MMSEAWPGTLGWRPFSRSSGPWRQGRCLGSSMLTSRPVVRPEEEAVREVPGVRQWGRAGQPHWRRQGEVEQKQVSEVRSWLQGFDCFSVQPVGGGEPLRLLGYSGVTVLFGGSPILLRTALALSYFVSPSSALCHSLICSPPSSCRCSAYGSPPPLPPLTGKRSTSQSEYLFGRFAEQ